MIMRLGTLPGGMSSFAPDLYVDQLTTSCPGAKSAYSLVNSFFFFTYFFVSMTINNSWISLGECVSSCNLVVSMCGCLSYHSSIYRWVREGRFENISVLMGDVPPPKKTHINFTALPPVYLNTIVCVSSHVVLKFCFWFLANATQISWNIKPVPKPAAQTQTHEGAVK